MSLASSCLHHNDCLPLLLFQRTRLKHLLQRGADPNAVDGYGWTLLHFAAYTGQPEVARILLDAVARTEPKEGQGFTPLHWAVYESALIPGSAEVASLLVAKGADVNARDQEGSTPLFWATWTKNTKMFILSVFVECRSDQVGFSSFLLRNLIL